MPLGTDYVAETAADFVGTLLVLYEVAPDDESDGT